MGLFRRKKNTPHPLADLDVWIVPLHVKAGAEALPDRFIGAFVSVICRAENPNLAVWSAIQAIEAMGYSVPESPTKVDHMKASDFANLVADNWAGLAHELPSQSEFYARMAEHRAVLGPFAAYEASQQSES
ncbi:hypothetical protein ACKU27_07990 [Sphingobium yanoikuyae]|jgi:hypothetical protein|uniref:hypothetical protein n=1 Tax=Sphingobium yanoikuyae TaxID=13690 RepID=UPI000F7E6BB4|nr:hypothetical protein [Sphingobium yanoikuyae]